MELLQLFLGETSATFLKKEGNVGGGMERLTSTEQRRWKCESMDSQMNDVSIDGMKQKVFP